MSMGGILILAEHRDGELRPVTHELIAAARDVRKALGDRVTVRNLKIVKVLSYQGFDFALII